MSRLYPRMLRELLKVKGRKGYEVIFRFRYSELSFKAIPTVLPILSHETFLK